MKQQIRQPGLRARFRPIHWRALGRGLLFALLLTQQAWAGVFCCCEPAPETQPVVAQSARPACHAQAEPALTGVVETRQPAPPRLLLCCALPQPEAERVTLLTPNQTVLPNTLPPLASHALVTSAVISRGTSPPPLQRPLYLALSCWLI